MTNTLSVTVGALAPVIFRASATAGPLAQLVPADGDGQIAPSGSALPHPLRAKAIDAYGNPIAGVVVTFSVIAAEGSIEGRTTVSDSAGLATSGQWTLGTSPGWQHVRAQSGDVEAEFTAESACPPDRVEQSCPESGQLIFVRPSDGQIYRIGATGADLTRLTSSATIGENNYVTISPAWSPDGRRIAFAVAHRGVAGLVDIYLMDADGSNVVRRTTGSGFFSVAWSPDGRRLAVSDEGENFSEIHVISAVDDGSLPVLLATNARSPAWSPDGKKIAFLHTNVDYGQDEIYTMNIDGTGAEALTTGGGFRSRPTWSPDGRRLAFSMCQPDGDGGFGCDAYSMNSDASGLRLLTEVGNADGAAWSPDGGLIAITLTGSTPSVAYVWAAGGTPHVVVSDATSAAWRP